MQAIIAVDGAKGPNPAFNKKLPHDLETNPFERDVPKGTVIDHADCWRLCLAYHYPGEDWLAEPYDDEAKAKVIPLREKEAREKGEAIHIPPAADAPADATPAPKAVRIRPPRSSDQ